MELRFSTSAQAEAALLAVQAGQIYLDGVKVSLGRVLQREMVRVKIYINS